MIAWRAAGLNPRIMRSCVALILVLRTRASNSTLLLQQLGVRSIEKGPTLMGELVALVQRMRPARGT